jgi:molybdopterin/thiamine biosynthesis adenylyltransferase
MDRMRERFFELFDPSTFKNIYVDVVGAGSVGSAVALHLGKMGVPNIRIIDYDTVSDVNIGVSLPYGPSDMGKPKVEVLAQRIKDLCDIDVKAFNGSYKDVSKPLGNIVIGTVDSIASRQEIYNNILMDDNVKYLIDTAMGALQINVKFIPKYRAKAFIEYGQKILSMKESDVPELRCTIKSTIHGTSVIAAIVCNYMMLIQKDENRALPYEEYSIRLAPLDIITKTFKE